MSDAVKMDTSSDPIEVAEEGIVTDEVARIREGRTSSAAVFADFIQYKKFHPTHVFCFYEGEDGYYYDCRIKEYLQSDNFITLIAKNKKNVLNVMKQIQADKEYENVCKMFFVDHDFDENQPPDKDIFETEGYSIENYYVDEDVFRRILRTAFHINEGNPDLQKCLILYRRTFEQFHKVMIPFNARVKYKHVFSSVRTDCSFQNYGMNKLVNIEVCNVTQKDDYQDILNDIDMRLKPDKNKLKQIEEELNRETDPFMIFRGKNELHCFLKFLSLLKEHFNASKQEDRALIFETSQKDIKVNFDPMNNPLGTLSQFANTTPKLIDFIVAHKL